MQRAVVVFLVALAGCTDAATGDAGVLLDGDMAIAGSDAAMPDDASAADDGAVNSDVPSVWQNQVIYLAIPDRFFDGDATNNQSGTPGCYVPSDPKSYHGGDLAGLRQKLPYLAELGVTAIWVTPLYLQSADRCGYHGYWADFTDPDDGAIEPELGSAADFTGFIDDAHALGVKVVLDMVVNHAGRTARVVTQHADWFHDPATCAALGDPAVYCSIGTKPLPDFAQEKPAVAAYLNAVSVGWLDRFAIDGIRMDTVKNVPVDYWKSSWLPAVKAVRAPLFIVGEVFDTGEATDLEPYLAAGFDSLFNYPLRPTLLDAFASGNSVDAVASKLAEEIAKLGYPTTRMLTTFLDNHDNPRFISSVPAGLTEDEIRRRWHLGLGALFTLPGIPELFYGDELGLYGGADPDNRRDMPAWAWSSVDRGGTYVGQALPNPQSTFAQVQKLIAIRRTNAALSAGGYAELWRQNGGAANVLAFFRSSGANRLVVAINNGAADSGAMSLPLRTNPGVGAADRAALPDGTVLTELLGAGAPSTVTLAGGAVKIDLPPKTIGIYVAP